MREQSASNTRGRLVGRFVVHDRIAAGGMATVHVGRLLGAAGFSRTVAIKRLHDAYAKDPEFVAMLLDEARIAAMIRKREKNASVIALYRGKTDESFGALTSDATNLSALELSTNAVLRVPKQGGAGERLVTALQVPTGIVVDATSIYVTVEATGSQGAVLKLAK